MNKHGNKLSHWWKQEGWTRLWVLWEIPSVTNKAFVFSLWGGLCTWIGALWPTRGNSTGEVLQTGLHQALYRPCLLSSRACKKGISSLHIQRRKICYLNFTATSAGTQNKLSKRNKITADFIYSALFECDSNKHHFTFNKNRLILGLSHSAELCRLFGITFH